MARNRTKEQARKFALKENRRVLWLDKRGGWHAATDWQNTPHYAVETEDLQPEKPR